MVDFTYEDLYELLRTEKFSTDLQPLKQSDIKKIADYLNIKQALLEKQTHSKEFFNQRNVDKIRTEIDNAKRLLKDVFEIRERKILNRAIFTSRSENNIRDSTNMLRIEEDIYSQLIAILQNNSKKFFEQLTNFPQPKELKTEKITDNSEQIRIKVLEYIPELTDSTLNTYGPFEKDQIVKLPEELTTILKKHGKIIEAENESA